MADQQARSVSEKVSRRTTRGALASHSCRIPPEPGGPVPCSGDYLDHGRARLVPAYTGERRQVEPPDSHQEATMVG